MAALIALIPAEPAPLRAPRIRAGWERTIEDDGWTSVFPGGRADGRFFSARLILRDAGNPLRAVFVCTGTRAVLNFLANEIEEQRTHPTNPMPWLRTWLTLPLLRADGSAPAVAIRAAWPDERRRDELGNPIGTLVAHWRRMAGAPAEDAET
jgi:hypothetical protein